MNNPKDKNDYETYFRYAQSVHSRFLYLLNFYLSPSNFLGFLRARNKAQPSSSSVPTQRQLTQQKISRSKPAKISETKTILMAGTLIILVVSYFFNYSSPKTKFVMTDAGEKIEVSADMSEAEIATITKMKPGMGLP